jgi:4-carboxymuconolactone decarboxylase
MTDRAALSTSLSFDLATRALVRLAARIAGGSELDVRDGLRETAGAATPEVWVEELILQSYLFCGFPRALNAAREWRRSTARNGEGVEAKGRGTGGGTSEMNLPDFLSAGEATCERVYGRFYSKLRQNIVALHPELDTWMIVEGYGKVLSRPALDLGRRELCIVAACVAAGQDRQLHSHLHGSRNVGVPDDVIGASLDALEGTVNPVFLERAVSLWAKVEGQV